MGLRLTTRTKLVAAFLAVALGSVVVGMVSLSALGHLQAASRQLVENQLPSERGLAALEGGFWAMRFDTTKAVALVAQGRADQLDALWRGREEARREAEEGLALFERLPMEADEAARWSEVVPGFQYYLEENARVWDALRRRDAAGAFAIQEGFAARVQREVVEPLRALMTLQARHGEEAQRRGEADAAWARGLTLWAMAATFAAALGLGVLLALSVSRPIERTVGEARRLGRAVAEGKLDARSDPRGVGEEFRPVLAALDELMGQLEVRLAGQRAAQEAVQRLARELEARVAERTAQLEKANGDLEAFAYSVSHDLRAPLRHVAGFVALLVKRTEGATDEKARHYAAVIAEAAGHMERMIDDLLAFSRAGRVELVRAAVEAGALVRELVAELGPEVGGRDVHWRVGELPTVHADRALLRLALANLLSNAVKFTRPRPRAEIEIGALRPRDGQVVLFVRDNGVGFDMKFADKLFSVFQRLHRAEDFEGTGVGLANVRRIVERHGGRAWAEGAPDRGATFFVSLPA